jgi:hypothetical protein
MEEAVHCSLSFGRNTFSLEKARFISGIYGFCINQNSDAKDFEYLIEDK